MAVNQHKENDSKEIFGNFCGQSEIASIVATKTPDIAVRYYAWINVAIRRRCPQMRGAQKRQALV